MKTFFLSKIPHSFEKYVGGHRHFEPFSNSMLTPSTPVSFGLRPAISSPAGAGSDRLLQTLLESAPHSNHVNPNL